jgi:hypothetical protein
MKKILMLTMFLMLLMAVPAFAGGAATAYDHSAISLTYGVIPSVGGGAPLVLNPQLNWIGAGWDAGGVMYGERTGNAYGEKGKLFIFTIPGFATATGELNGKIVSDGYFNHGSVIVPGSWTSWANAGASSTVTGNGWELALAGLKNPSTSTLVHVEGTAFQGNWAGTQSGPGFTGSLSYAFGGNSSMASFSNTDKDSGTFLSFSSVCGEAFTKGETHVYAKIEGIPGDWGKATSWGFTKNFAEGNNGVAGSGNMYTGTFLQGINTNNWAGTQTISSFSYDNNNKGWGIAGGYGQSTMNSFSNGITASTHSVSYSFAK